METFGRGGLVPPKYSHKRLLLRDATLNHHETVRVYSFPSSISTKSTTQFWREEDMRTLNTALLRSLQDYSPVPNRFVPVQWSKVRQEMGIGQLGPSFDLKLPETPTWEIEELKPDKIHAAPPGSVPTTFGERLTKQGYPKEMAQKIAAHIAAQVGNQFQKCTAMLQSATWNIMTTRMGIPREGGQNALTSTTQHENKIHCPQGCFWPKTAPCHKCNLQMHLPVQSQTSRWTQFYSALLEHSARNCPATPIGSIHLLDRRPRIPKQAPVPPIRKISGKRSTGMPRRLHSMQSLTSKFEHI